MHELELSWPVKEELINLCFAFRLKECSHKQEKLLGYRSFWVLMKPKASSCIKEMVITSVGRNLHKVLFSMLLTVQAFAVVKLGLGVAMARLGMVTM
ncbi:unnamed protein product [Sphagnum compactum]